MWLSTNALASGGRAARSMAKVAGHDQPRRPPPLFSWQKAQHGGAAEHAAHGRVRLAGTTGTVT